MERKIVSTTSAPAALGPYSQAVRAGGFLFCSGQLGLDPATGELVAGVKAQAERAMRNLEAVAAEAGTTLDAAVKTTIFLASMADFAVVNEAYASFFAGSYPARSTVQVAGLPKGGLVEIEMVIGL